MPSQAWEDEQKRRWLERAKQYANQPLHRATGTTPAPSAVRIAASQATRYTTPTPTRTPPTRRPNTTWTRGNWRERIRNTPVRPAPTNRYRFGDAKLVQPPSNPKCEAELRNAQFQSRNRRMERELRAWEDNSQQRIAQEVVERALARQRAKLPELERRGQEALQAIRIQSAAARHIRNDAEARKEFNRRIQSGQESNFRDVARLIGEIEARTAATPNARNLPRRDADINALVARNITDTDRRELALALATQRPGPIAEHGAALLGRLEEKRKGLDAAYQHHDPKNIARRSLVDPLRATRQSDGRLRSLQHKAGPDTAGFDLGMFGHGGLDPINMARGHSPEALAEATRILKDPTQRQQVLNESGITLPGRPLSVRRWFANRGARDRVETVMAMSRGPGAHQRSLPERRVQESGGHYGEHVLSDHDTGIYKAAAQERISGYIDHLNTNPSANKAEVQAMIEREQRRSRRAGALDIYGRFVPTGGQGAVESMADDVIPAAVGGGRWRGDQSGKSR